MPSRSEVKFHFVFYLPHYRYQEQMALKKNCLLGIGLLVYYVFLTGFVRYVRERTLQKKLRYVSRWGGVINSQFLIFNFFRYFLQFFDKSSK